MEIYTIGGLGADERIFKDLDIGVKTTHLRWQKSIKSESLQEYCNKLKSQIRSDQPFGLLGVSFGGIVAIELSKLVNPKFLILISTVTNYKELPLHYKILGSVFLPLLPTALIKPPNFIMTFLFGAKDKNLLKEIINDTEPEFIKWALNSILSWKGTLEGVPFIRLHGTNDRIIPLKGDALEIEKGGHFMIVEDSKRITELIKNYID